jgi:hypothetical protein
MHEKQIPWQICQNLHIYPPVNKEKMGSSKLLLLVIPLLEFCFLAVKLEQREMNERDREG